MALSASVAELLASTAIALREVHDVGVLLFTAYIDYGVTAVAFPLIYICHTVLSPLCADIHGTIRLGMWALSLLSQAYYAVQVPIL